MSQVYLGIDDDRRDVFQALLHFSGILAPNLEAQLTATIDTDERQGRVIFEFCARDHIPLSCRHDLYGDEPHLGQYRPHNIAHLPTMRLAATTAPCIIWPPTRYGSCNDGRHERCYSLGLASHKGELSAMSPSTQK